MDSKHKHKIFYQLDEIHQNLKRALLENQRVLYTYKLRMETQNVKRVQKGMAF